MGRAPETFKLVIRLMVVFSLVVSLAGTAVAEEADTSGKARAVNVGTNQGTIRINNMDLSVKPEYDTRDVLVIYRFDLVNTGSEPYDGDLIFHVPKGATNDVHICRVEGSNLHASCALYQSKTEGQVTTFTWKPDWPIKPGENYHLYIEFYYNPIQGTKDKTIDFFYHPSYPIDRLRISVLPPLRSSNVKLDPEAASTLRDSEGFTHYHYEYSNVTGDTPIEVKISYTKEDNNPSIARTTGGGTTSGGGSAGGTNNLASIALVAVIALVFGGMLFMAARRPSQATARRGGTYSKRAASRAPAGKAARTAADSSRGRRAAPQVITDERKAARQMLLDGRISEDTYKQILADLEKEGR